MRDTPDFYSIEKELIKLPYRDEPYFKFYFADPRLKDYSLIMIADDTCNLGNPLARLVTFTVRYPRYVHSEFLRHRVLSRNASSSRARSVKVTFKDVMTDPVIPIFTINQKGMSGKFSPVSLRDEQVKIWLNARDAAVANALALLVNDKILENKNYHDVANHYEEIINEYYEKGYDSCGELKEGILSTHKQNVNRLLEPFTQFEEIITGSYWTNFLDLRDHEDAQPEIRAVARLVSEALSFSIPNESVFHLPFIDSKECHLSDNFEDMRDILMKSASECAQISYRDKSKEAKDTARVALGERLLEQKHLSPFEHVALSSAHFKNLIKDSKKNYSGNLDPSWIQLRQLISYTPL